MAAVDQPCTTYTRRQNALAEIQFTSIISDDDLTPSEDELPDERARQLERAQSALGISIGEQQRRLTSPKTPAAEKAAALEETVGGFPFDSFEQYAEPLAQSAPPHIDGGEGDATLPAFPPHLPLPSPWRAKPRTFQDKVGDHRAALRQHLQPGSRRRASSGGSMTETVRKYINFTLPSMPRTYKDLHFSLPSFSTLSLDGPTPPGTADRRRRGTFAHPAPSLAIPQHDGTEQSTLHGVNDVNDSDTTLADLPRRPSHDRNAPRLRRSNSEGSLAIHRQKSFASSLGDDSRFDDVQGMVNSRLKAIRDSWQDANFKFPSPTLPNFSFGVRDDMFRSRHANSPAKPRDPANGTAQRTGQRPQYMQSAPTKTKAKRSGSTAAADSETHPFFTQALQELEGDLVVLGGYRGSILRSAEPPNRQLWVPIKVGLNLRKVDLEVPYEADADERMEESIIPSGMLKNIGPVDISRRLFKRLRACDNARDGRLRVHDYGYDWRLSPHFLSRRMIESLESLPCNQPNVPPEKRGAIIVAHSLGGLIMRHAINQRPDLVAGVVYAGVPQKCVNILGPFRNGDDVLFSSRVLTAQVNFSIRTSYALLPLDGKCFINKWTKEEYPVDFFDPNTWKECRLSPCLAAPLPRPEAPKDRDLSVSSLLSAVSQALPNFPSRKQSISRLSSSNASGYTSAIGDTIKGAADAARNGAEQIAEGGAESAGMGPQMSQGQTHSIQTSNEPNPATTVTIPYDKAFEYLARTLAEIKRFKQETEHIPAHTAANAYPPIALIYGKTTPTVYGAKVESREAIKRADAYDELAFASGDGVVLARAAMVPEGYSVVRGGVVSSDRGHVTLLGDLEAVGRCLHVVNQARRSGVGTGQARLTGRTTRASDVLGVQNAPIRL
jgi:hypothetical protein